MLFRIHILDLSKSRPLAIIPLIFILLKITIILKIYFYVKMKIRGTIFNDPNLDKCYPNHNLEQHSRDFNRRLDTLDNANVSGIVLSSIITQKVFNEKIFSYSVLKSS